MRVILLDPTASENTLLSVDGTIQTFSHATRDDGKALITALQKLKIQPTDQLQVITGPGNFTAIRSCALVINTIACLTSCRLVARTAKEKRFRPVTQIIPFYGKPPSITISQKSR